MERYIRLKKITIQGFKNIANGTLSLMPATNGLSSVTGIYGQNGSGKSAMIDVIDLLSYILRGNVIPERFADYVMLGRTEATISYEFAFSGAERISSAIYTVSFRKNEITDDGPVHNVCSIFREKLQVTYKKKERAVTALVLDTGSVDLFAPDVRVRDYIGEADEKRIEAVIGRRVVELRGASYVFSPSFVKSLLEQADDKMSEVGLIGKTAILLLSNYGRKELFVVNSEVAGYVNLNMLPMLLRYDEEGKDISERLMLSITGPSAIKRTDFELVTKVIGSMNMVLSMMIPGLSINVKEEGEETVKDGIAYVKVELASVRGDNSIPLRYESDGIKKIVSILNLLIVMYNRPSITVAIDELDAGIFEYLLGEILKIVSEQGKGQLVFTSHNLRPLETLDRKCIAFTTTNPENRYARMKNVMANNNLRDMYYREIAIGTQDEELYSFTDTSRIAQAFRRVSEARGNE